MDRPVNLIPLLCTRCRAPIPAVQDEAAWVCTGCGQAVYLDDSEGLKPVDVHYAAGIAPGLTGKPFWVVEGRVSMSRQVFGGGDQSRTAVGYWSHPRLFFIPAFDTNMDTLLQTGIQLLAHPPVCQDGPPVQFLPVALSPLDLKAAAEFIVVAIEAARRDKMRSIDFTLELNQPVLWILP